MNICDMTFEEIDEDASYDVDCKVIVLMVQSLATHPSFADTPPSEIWADFSERAVG